MNLQIIEDNETIFKYSIEDFKFTHFNTTNEGQKLTEEEKAEKVNESLKYIENLKATESTFKNIIDETYKKKEEEKARKKRIYNNKLIKKQNERNEQNRAFKEYLNSKSDTESD